MNQFWLIWQKLTKSTDWLRDGQGKATNGSGKNCFHLGCIQKITFRVAQNARNSQKWRWAIEHYNIINRASLVGDEENRKMYPPIAVAITRISECWEPPLLPPGLLPSGVPLCPSPLPSIWNILTPSLTLTFLWHFSSTPPFIWLLKSLPLGDKHFWNLWLQSRAFHFHLGHRLLPMSQDQRSDEANWSPRETESNWLPAAPTGVAVTHSFSECHSVFNIDTI